MKKWIVTILVILALAALGLTVRIWVPWLLEFAIRNKEKVESLQELAELISQIAAWSAAVVVFVYKLWRRKPPIEPSLAAPTVANSHAARDINVNTAGHDVQTGGTHAQHDVRVDGTLINQQTNIYQTAPTAPTPTLNPLHQLPPPPADFTGRTTELAELRAAIEKGGVHISGLQGQGGVGKTALALKLAAELAPNYPDAQIYLDLKGVSEKPLTAAEALSHVLRTFHPEAKLPETVDELSPRYLSVLHNKHALLLMDNAKDAVQVQSLIPHPNCVLLVTSRYHFDVEGLHARNLDTLPPEDAAGLLLRIAPRIDGEAEAIAQLCGHLALALRLAARAIAERIDLSPAEYRQRLTDEKQRLKLLGGGDKGVEASISLSYNLLDAETQKRWRMLAVFPDTFDAAAAASVWEIEGDPAQETLSHLLQFSMLEWNDATKRYRLHDLMRAFARQRSSRVESDAAARRHAMHYVKILAQANRLYLKGGESILGGLALFDLEWGNIQAGQAWAGAMRTGHSEAAKLCSDVARTSQDRAGEGRHTGNLGTAHFDAGDYHRAIDYHEKALDISREIGDRQAEGQDLGNLGSSYGATGDYHRAIDYTEKAMAILHETGSRPDESAVLTNLGVASSLLGDNGSALKYYEQSLAIARETGKRDGEALVLWNMSLSLDKLGDRKKAIQHAEAALKIYEEIEHPNAAKVRKKLDIWRNS